MLRYENDLESRACMVAERVEAASMTPAGCHMGRTIMCALSMIQSLADRRPERYQEELEKWLDNAEGWLIDLAKNITCTL